MELADIEEYAQLSGADTRQAKHKLALEATSLAHGRAAAEKAQQAAMAAFSGAVSMDMPSISVELPKMIVEVLVDSGLCKSKSDAKRQIKGGAIKVDYGSGKESVRNIDAQMSDSGILWFGKKKCVRVEK